MARSQRLLELIQVLRRHRQPVSGQALADELSVSLRTVYRDIQTLIGQGATIDGEAGLGFVLRPGFVLPPLMFSDEELEALVLGLRWVAQRTDASFEHAAMNALAKIAAVLPDDLRNNVEGIGLIAIPSRDAGARHDLAPIRAAIRAEQMVVLDYADVKGDHTRRTVWPIALAFFENSRVLAAWCELRQDFRHFRIDRIIALRETGQRYPQRRRVLMKQWREIEKIAERT
ncbi:MAG TPA: YafY family protein [Xanthobacteraceae bacterium]|nr:YafY family protein [Xanthobacteraceae bacterium]